MHPKTLLDACSELVRLTLKFDHPADAIVSRFFRDHRALGPRERATLAETVYTVLRKKLLFDSTNLKITLDNVEGMALGPKLPDGSQSLWIVSDDNFDKDQVTQFLLFRIKPQAS